MISSNPIVSSRFGDESLISFNINESLENAINLIHCLMCSALFVLVSVSQIYVFVLPRGTTMPYNDK